MIAALTGELAEIDLSGEIIVDVHGVGYQVTVGARHAASLGAAGSLVSLAVHTHVREGAIALYGFPSVQERKTFELLLNTHGVGPALALAILGVHSPASLSAAVLSGDIDALALVPGVGKKTAQRLVLELAQRLELESAPSPGRRAVRGTQAEVREALVALGYANEEIANALQALSENDSVEELLREALRELAPRR